MNKGEQVVELGKIYKKKTSEQLFVVVGKFKVERMEGGSQYNDFRYFVKVKLLSSVLTRTFEEWEEASFIRHHQEI